MKAIWTALLLLCLGCTECLAEAAYQNPMNLREQYGPFEPGADDYGIGDPFVLRHNGCYYLYASSSEDRVRVFTSRDLVNWEYQGYCTENRDVYFAYAPEVVYWHGSFYMITSPQGNGHYILKSDDPLGVFRPITENFGHSIDGSFYRLDDGSLMMLYPDNWIIKSRVLNSETLLPQGAAFSTGATLNHWTEGPGLFRRGDWYYLTYTGNYVCSTGYRVAWSSRKDSPIGRYANDRDASTLLVNSVFGDDFKGLGHSANVIGPDLDSMYITYHSLVSLVGPARQYNLDRLLTNGGALYSTGPTDFPMPVPSMPDVYGDAAGELNDFTRTDAGYFAALPGAQRFTQEWNIILDGGIARVLLGQSAGGDVFAELTQTSLSLQMADGETLLCDLPPLGPQGRLHTLRVEKTPDVLYLEVDGMRVLTHCIPDLTPERMGAYSADGVSHSFMAATAQALGSGDAAARKAIPGTFSAVHALNADALAYQTVGEFEERAVQLGSADYAVRVAQDGQYCFDLQVLQASEQGSVTILLGKTPLWTGRPPAYAGSDALYTFTTDPISLPAGDHILTVRGENVVLNRLTAFAWAEAEPWASNFTQAGYGDNMYTLGNFMVRPSDGVLRISGGKNGFALLGQEGYTDYSMDVRFQIPQEGSGSSGILLRATDVSLYDAQVEESYFGYGLTISSLGVSLRAVRYGTASSPAFCPVPEWKTAQEGALHIEAQGGEIRVYLPGREEPLLSFREANPFSHGLCGFFSTGKELSVLECSIVPLERNTTGQ